MVNLRAEVSAFAAAANWIDELVRTLPDAVWNQPGLGEWSMRALVGHTSRALLTVEQYLDAPSMTEDVESAETYYERGAQSPAVQAAVLQRGIDAGEALGQNPASEVSAIVRRVLALPLGADDRVLSTPVGGIRLSNYLPTRTFELVVHGLDIAHAAGLPSQPPRVALRRAFDLAGSLALRSGSAAEILMALTGRRELSRGFSII